MATYHVRFAAEVTADVAVEAATPEDAIAAAYESDDMPGSIVIGAFGSGTEVEQSSDWTPALVNNDQGCEVWKEKHR